MPSPFMLLSKIVIQELVLGNLPSLSYPEITPVMQVQPFTNPQSTTAEILQKILDSKVTRFTCYLGFCPWNYAILKKFRLLAEFRFPFYKNSEFHNFAHVNVKHVTQIWALPYVF